MKLFFRGKDGGPNSTVFGAWLIEWKRVISIALLRFEGNSREAFHSHAFDSLSWVLSGELTEEQIIVTDCHGHIVSSVFIVHRPSFRPIVTLRTTFHKVNSRGRTRVFTIRGPWARTWNEFLPAEQRTITLTSGRHEEA